MTQKKKTGEKSSWLEAFHGWEPDGNEIDTYWPGDPAVDKKKSDTAGYYKYLDKGKLVLNADGPPPVNIHITLPGPSQHLELKNILVTMSQDKDIISEELAARAFQLCVTFPDLDLEMHDVGRRKELPDSFMGWLAKNKEVDGATMIYVIGSWIFSKTFVSDAEKKA